jgi:hypothetical protein
MSYDSRILHSGHAPTPFTAEEIRIGCPAGRTIRLVVDDGGSRYIRTIRFVAVDENAANQESAAFTVDGEALGEPAIARTTWLEFQEHASFPAAQTTIGREALSSPLGRLECLVYVVEDGDSTTRYWFAATKPGMPVKVETQAAGTVTYEMSMVGDEVG